MADDLHSKHLILCIVFILVSACATSPIAKQYLQEAKEDNLLFPMALRNPDAHIGSTVVWGGRVIETKNLKKGSHIVVLETSLARDTRPIDPRYSKGRFIAISSDFLDPELYTKSREVTIAGVITGKKKMPIGGTVYTYPVVTIKQIYIWEEEQEPVYYYYPYGYWGWGGYFRRY
jgi:outer membrane lipoprotein